MCDGICQYFMQRQCDAVSSDGIAPRHVESMLLEIGNCAVDPFKFAGDLEREAPIDDPRIYVCKLFGNKYDDTSE